MKFILGLLLAAQIVNVEANLQDDKPDDIAFSAALQQAIAVGGTCKVGPGTLILSKYPQELRKDTLTSLNRVTIEGEDTIIHGISDKGFDVLQLNRVTDITIKNLTIKSTKRLPDPTHGVNGISMTNGTSNVRIENVTVDRMNYVKTNYYNGGKGLTVQSGDSFSRNIVIIGCKITNCPYGISIDTRGQAGDIHILDSEFENCLAGVVPSSTVKTFTEINIWGNTFRDVNHPFLSGRMNTNFVGNKVYITKLSEFPDIWSDTIPILLLEVDDVKIVGNHLFKIEDSPWIYSKKSKFIEDMNVIKGTEPLTVESK